MNLSPLVTLVDPDSKGLQTLTYSFEKERFTVTGTSDPARARQLIVATGARAAVIAVRAPEQRSLELIAELRRSASTQTLPIVAFGPAALRAPALEAGAFDYLDAPILVRDATVVSRLWLQLRAPVTDRDAIPEIIGPLDLLHGLYFVIRAMNATGRSGVLQIARGARKGEVKFTDGDVTSAEVRSLQAFPALHQLLLWGGAEVSLKLREVPRRAQFSAKGPEILEECERFLRDVTHAARQLGSLQTVFVTDERQAGLRQPGVPEEVAPVARFFDGVRTLGEVIEESPFRIFDTLRVVKRLVDSGTLLPRAGAAAAAAAPTNPSAVPRARTKSGAQLTAPTSQPRSLLDPSGPDRRGVPGDRRKSLRRTPVPFEKPAAKPAPAPIPLVTKKSPSGGFAAGEIRSSQRPTRTPPHPLGAARSEPTVHVTLEPAPSLDAQLPVSGTLGGGGGGKLERKIEHNIERKIEREVERSLDQAYGGPNDAGVPTAVPVSGTAPIGSRTQSAAEKALPHAAAPAARPPANAAPISARQPAPSGAIRQRKNTKTTKTPVPSAPAFSDLEADFFAREADLYKSESGDTFDDLDRGGDGKHRPLPRGGGAARAKKK